MTLKFPGPPEPQQASPIAAKKPLPGGGPRQAETKVHYVPAFFKEESLPACRNISAC